MDKESRDFFDGVSLSKEKKEGIPQIEKVGGAIERYGRENARKRQPVVSLFFGPGLYQVLGYVPVLKQFEQNNVNVALLSGVGMGSLVAALYAKGLSPDLIEWKLTNLFSKLKGEKIYSDNWREICLSFVNKEFGDKEIQHLKKFLVLAIKDGDEVRFIKRGKLSSILKNNLEMKSVSPLTGDFAPFKSLKQKGADIIFAFDIMGENVNFIRYNDYIYGVYAKAAGIIQRDKNFARLSVLRVPLDSIKNRQNLIADSINWSQRYMEKVKAEIEKWRSYQKSAGE